MNRWRSIKWSLHPLFVIILFFSVLTGYFIELIILFSIVLLHELGHIFMAHAVGWKVKSVKLLPFGGVVEVDDVNGTRAIDELLVAIAGPMQNVWMIGIAIVCDKLQLWSYDWVAYFITANIWIACFNLIPIVPLDGGKIVQALMSYCMSYYRTIIWSSRISIVLSCLLILYATVPSFGLTAQIKLNEAMIGMFLLISNIVTLRHLPYIMYRFVLTRSKHFARLERIYMRTEPILISSTMSVNDIFKCLYRERINLFCVVDRNNEQIKMLSERKIIEQCTDRFDVHRAVSEFLR